MTMILFFFCQEIHLKHFQIERESRTNPKQIKSARAPPLISLPCMWCKLIAQPGTSFCWSTFLQMGRLDYMSGAPPGENMKQKTSSDHFLRPISQEIQPKCALFVKNHLVFVFVK